MAQALNTCFAERYQAPVLVVQSCIGRSDELVRGTAAGQRHVALAATHDAELVELLRGEFDACHFTDTIGPEGLMFDHRLAPGPATTRNAITLLELHGAPPSVVKGALARAAELDRVRGTSA